MIRCFNVACSSAERLVNDGDQLVLARNGTEPITDIYGYYPGGDHPLAVRAGLNGGIDLSAGLEGGVSGGFLGTGVEIQGGAGVLSLGWTGLNLPGGGIANRYTVGIGGSVTPCSFRAGGSHTFSRSFTSW